MLVFLECKDGPRHIGWCDAQDTGLGIVKVPTGPGARDFVGFVVAFVPKTKAVSVHPEGERAVFLFEKQDPSLLPGWKPKQGTQ